MEKPSAQESANRIVEGLHRVARANLPVGIGLGRVINPPPDLKVAWNSILLTKEDIYISDFLLLGYERRYKGQWKAEEMKGDIRTTTQSRRGGGGDPAFRSHTHKVNAGYKADATAEYAETAISLDFGLQIGDLVTILPLEGAQQFLLLSRVVLLSEWQPPDSTNSLIKESQGIV